MAEAKKELSREEQQNAMYMEILEGVQKVMTSDDFKNFLDTSSRLLSANNYSINNTILAYLQRPQATYLMGYEKWKEYGRQVKQGAKGIHIMVPYFAYEREKDSFYYSILNKLKQQLKDNPDMQVASARIGKSNIEFTLNQNRVMGWKLNGKEMGIFTEPQAKRFFDQKILGKIPVGYNRGTVFDVQDVFIPDRLWLKRGFEKEDIVRDENGKSIRNQKKEYWIKNSEKRIQKFNPSLDFTIPENDTTKMELFYDVLVSVCEDRNVTVGLKPREEDKTLKSGAEGYFLRSADGTPGGIILSNTLSPTERCSTLLHEMGHADLHNTLTKAKELSREMREVQAEATAYMVGKQFGIQTDISSFQYLSLYAKGLEVESLHSSLQAIQKATSTLMLDISNELKKNNLNQQLEPIPEEPMPEKEVDAIIRLTKSVVLDSMETVDAKSTELEDIYDTSSDIGKMIVIQQKEAIKNQSRECDLMLSLCDDLEKALTFDSQMDAVHLIDASQKRLVDASQEYDRLEQEYLNYQDSESLICKFKQDPLSVLKNLQAAYPQLNKLSANELQYVATSSYMKLISNRLLQRQPEKFVEHAIAAVEAARTVQAKNGMFIEIPFYYEASGNDAIKSGMLLHPKTANKLLKEAERIQKDNKSKAEANGTPYPSASCYLSVMQFNENGFDGIEGWINVGTGEQKDLTDAIKQRSGPDNADIAESYSSAIKERVKDKQILLAEIPTEELKEDEIVESLDTSDLDKDDAKNDMPPSLSQWKNDIERHKEKEIQEQEDLEKENAHSMENEQEKEPVSL